MKRTHRPVAFVVTRNHSLPDGEQAGLHGPPVDVVDDGAGWRLIFEIPGAIASGLELQIDGLVVTLRGERKPTEGECGQFLRIERVAGPFERVLELPEPPDPEKARASYTDGILTVEIPRLRPSVGRTIPVRRGTPAKKP